MSKTIGNIGRINIDITDPIKMKFETEPRNLSMFCGTNGSGKSLILKIMWIVAYITETFIMLRKSGQPATATIAMAQYVFDKSFDDQNFNGTIKCLFSNTGSIEIKLEKGKVLDVIMDIDDDVESGGVPIFMSAETRTFDEFRKYLQTRKLVGVLGEITPGNAAASEKLLDFFKLYDMVFFERMFMKLLHKPLILSHDIKKSLNDTFKISKEIESIGLDEAKSEIYYIDSKGVVGNICTLSKGEQSLINMQINSKM